MILKNKNFNFFLFIFLTLFFPSNCFGVLEVDINLDLFKSLASERLESSYSIDPDLLRKEDDPKPELELKKTKSFGDQIGALQARISLTKGFIARAQIEGRVNDVVALKKSLRQYESSLGKVERSDRWENAGWVAKPFYAVSDAWKGVGDFCGGVRRGVYGFFGKDAEASDEYAKLATQYSKSKNSIVNSRNAALLLATLGAGYCVKKYYDHKKKKEIGSDEEFIPDFSRRPILTERVVAAAVEFFYVLLKNGGPGLPKAILKAGEAGYSYKPHKIKLAAEDVLDGVYEKDPEFKNAWVSLIKWLARDYGVWSLTGASGALLEYLPAHGPFVFDLIFPLIQTFMIWHCLMPDMKAYVFYNLVRHIVKYNVMKYFEFHASMDRIVAVSVVSVVEKINECLNNPDMRLLRESNPEFARAIVISETLKSIIPGIIQEIGREGIEISSDNIGFIVDRALIACFGVKFKTAIKIVDYSGEYLRKVDWEKFGQQYKVDYSNKPKTMSDVLEFMASVKQTIEKYREDRKFLRQEQMNKKSGDLELDFGIGLDGASLTVGTADPKTETHVSSPSLVGKAA